MASSFILLLTCLYKACRVDDEIALLVKKYDKRLLKVVFCVVFHTTATAMTMASAGTIQREHTPDGAT